MEDHAPPFSRTVAVESVGEAGSNVRFSATPAECERLAQLDELVALRDLTVEAQLTRRGREGLFARGRVTAVVTQTCVVTLDLFETQVDEPFEIAFAPEAEAKAAYERAMAELEAATDKARLLAEQPDPPDPIIDGRIDLGALACEFLALGLDPYPRKPGAAFEGHAEEDEPASPFAALSKMKKD
ncbi:DUF177 domain-containing protein [Rhodoblastus acidophilus]|jgi:uncharacterized metal-binding protein YceD (DUF177 family)|uniref:DUF177 domain-containing protein n=1 Tax=Rhodoblastus acidophilus TaxID=1074 RepID=A0A6N8DU36_RHOAC|nr:DUF177 domain-containing protein [Rhodoblastus acidophilus]MCW2275988.1 uncharacterized metal-binding protein YceD (DUF177 family) [Rhodoblastus acidophilus]MTV32661.1 DUF177 domain-containing protein [Rhodoblastus acidophilus]